MSQSTKTEVMRKLAGADGRAPGDAIKRGGEKFEVQDRPRPQSSGGKGTEKK